jgi:5-methylcytosine-specific restriction endonuclease McrA
MCVALLMCQHERHEVRFRTLSNGVRTLVMQCLICGRSLRSYKQQDNPDLCAKAEDNPYFDPEISERYWQHRHAQQRTEYEKRRDDRKREYQEYLASPWWWARRQARIAKDGGKCQAALDGCEIVASEVHHLTYQHTGNEPLFDIVSVCRSCHKQITDMDNEAKGG